jgi:hypothetical protein
MIGGDGVKRTGEARVCYGRPTLLDALRSFTVFMTTDEGVRIKVVPRYQQFRSVHIALNRLREGKTAARTACPTAGAASSGTPKVRARA